MKMDENKSLPEAATCKGTMAESLWESNSGKLREYKVCLPKTRDISNEASQEASNDEPSRLEQAIIEGERAVMANPNIPQALSTIRNSIDYEIYVRQAQNDAGRARVLDTPRHGVETECAVPAPKNAWSPYKMTVVKSKEQIICEQNSQSSETI